MRKFAAFFILAVSLLNIVSAQEQLPVEKKMVVGSDGRIFINKDLGVYLWISDSPDENSTKVRLISDSSKKYTNPMYFDTEGYNTFRSPSQVDTSTKRIVYPEQDIIYEVYTDSKAPATRGKIIAKNSATIKEKQYCSGDLKVALLASDEMSGCQATYYSIASTTYKEYTDSLVFNTEGENKLKFYSADKTGNRETVQELFFVIDNTAPVSSYSIGLGKKIILEAKDNLSGVKAIYYQVDNGKSIIYSSPVKLNKNSSLTYWAVDNVKNTEEKKTIDSKELSSK